MIQSGFRYSDNYSKGCQSCQEGKWLCIFLTHLCPASCIFCPSPYSDDRIVSSFGDSKEQIMEYIGSNDFYGIGFSGGDPFMKFERLLDWLSYFKLKLPHLYIWAYTSGISVTRGQIEEIAANGLDELRFNIAATGYNSPQILEKIKFASKLVPHVAIEIPSIENHADTLKKVLPELDKIGVEFLNLHEYIITDKLKDTISTGDFVLNKKIPIKYSTQSRLNTEHLIEHCQRSGLQLKINNCSLEKKEEQMRQRRLKMGQIFKLKSDIINEDGLIIREIGIPGKYSRAAIEKLIANVGIENLTGKAEKVKLNLQLESHTTILLKLLPPMGIGEKFQLLSFTTV